MARRTWLTSVLASLALLAAACGGGGNPGGQAGLQQSSSASNPSTSGSTGGGGGGGNGQKIVVGSANFAENQIIANMYALVLQKAGYNASVKQLTTREVIIPALKSGALDVEPDYAATLLEFLDGGKGLASPDVKATVDKLRQQLSGSGLAALDPADAIDTNGFAVRKQTADQLGLKTLSDLKGHTQDMVLGGAPECPKRPFCLPGLQKVYGLNFQKFVPLDAGGPLTHQALQQGKIDVGELFTTDASLNGLVLLDDDKHLQNADNIVPVVNKKVDSTTLDKAINAVQQKLTTQALQQLNGEVINQHKDAADVAQAWLKDNGLL